MLVRVKIDQAQTLRDLEVETYRDTFGPYIVEKDLEDYFSTVLSLEQIEKDLRDPESETYFVLNEDQEICGFLKINWGQAQTEPVEMDKSFEIQRIYVKKEWHGAGFGKEIDLEWTRSLRIGSFHSRERKGLSPLPKPASSWKTQNERIKTRVDGDLGKITRFLLGPWYLTYVS